MTRRMPWRKLWPGRLRGDTAYTRLKARERGVLLEMLLLADDTGRVMGTLTEPMTVAQLARELNEKPSHITSWVETLISVGLVERNGETLLLPWFPGWQETPKSSMGPSQIGPSSGRAQAEYMPSTGRVQAGLLVSPNEIGETRSRGKREKEISYSSEYDTAGGGNHNLGTENSAVHDFLRFYAAEWERRYGERYPLQGGEDGKRAKEALKVYDLTKLQVAATAYLDCSDTWYVNSGHHLRLFWSDLPKFIAQVGEGGKGYERRGGDVAAKRKNDPTFYVPELPSDIAEIAYAQQDSDGAEPR